MTLTEHFTCAVCGHERRLIDAESCNICNDTICPICYVNGLCVECERAEVEMDGEVVL